MTTEEYIIAGPMEQEGVDSREYGIVESQVLQMRVEVGVSRVLRPAQTKTFSEQTGGHRIMPTVSHWDLVLLPDVECAHGSHEGGRVVDGVLCPVAVLDPIQIDGHQLGHARVHHSHVVPAATHHSEDEMQWLKLYIAAWRVYIWAMEWDVLHKLPTSNW